MAAADDDDHRGRPVAGAVPPTRLVVRLQAPAQRATWRLRGRNPVAVAARVALRASGLRLGGRAAEMCFYLLLSAVPLLTALGTGLGLLGRWLDPDAVGDAQAFLVQLLDAVLSPALAASLGAPLVRELLAQEQTGFAVGSALVALVVASRVVRSALRVLREGETPVEERRPVLLFFLSFVLTFVAVLAGALMLLVLVVGPLFGGGERLAAALGAGEVFATVWAVGRWPVLLLVVAAGLATLYRVGAPVRVTWRSVVPGAVLATAALVGLVVAFRASLAVLGAPGPTTTSGDEAVQAAATVVGALVAAMLLGWFGSGVVLLGGLVNEEWAAAGAAGAPGDAVPGASTGDGWRTAREDGGHEGARGGPVSGARVGEQHQVDGAELGQPDHGTVAPSVGQPVRPPLRAQR